MIIVNSSPIIALGKVGRLELLKGCFRRITIPAAVQEEVLRKPDTVEAQSLQKGLADGWIAVEKINVPALMHTEMLGPGEKEAISLAAKHHCVAIIDDDLARSYAALLKVEVHGTLYVLLLAWRKKLLKKDEVREIVEDMMKEGFYLSTEVYAEFWKNMQ